MFVWGSVLIVGFCGSLRHLPGNAHCFNLPSKVRNWVEAAGEPNPGLSGLLRLLRSQNNPDSNWFPIGLEREIWNRLYASEIWLLLCSILNLMSFGLVSSIFKVASFGLLAQIIHLCPTNAQYRMNYSKTMVTHRRYFCHVFLQAIL